MCYEGVLLFAFTVVSFQQCHFLFNRRPDKLFERAPFLLQRRFQVNNLFALCQGQEKRQLWGIRYRGQWRHLWQNECVEYAEQLRTRGKPFPSHVL